MYEKRLENFKNLFYKLSNIYGSSTVFTDFVKMCSISIYNSFGNDKQMEQEYLRTINLYEKQHQNIFPEMFGELVMMYEESQDITDILGPFYEKEHLGNNRIGQFFTPSHISDFMAEIALQNDDTLKEQIRQNGFITMQEPTCGAGRYGSFSC